MAAVGVFGQNATKFVSFSGADIVVSIADKVFGNLQSVQYAVQREIAPIYVMGSPVVMGYARGKRAITGSLVFINYDRDALIHHVRALIDDGARLHVPPLQVMDNGDGSKWGTDILTALSALNDVAVNQFSEENTRIPVADQQARGRLQERWLRYADQIPPFDITISFLNEVGSTAHMRIEGVQILNEGMGMSIDDVVLDKAYTFIAMDVYPLTEGWAKVS